jgi:hypothetical protein
MTRQISIAEAITRAEFDEEAGKLGFISTCGFTR